MTPTQLKAYSAVVRLGSVKDAAAEIGVTEAAVSGHIAQLRRELDDQLFHRSGGGLAFTPGGLRLASRANEMLGLQDITMREVSEAGAGRRVLRLAVSSLFAEFSAPGLIELFSTRAKDLGVEMSVAGSDDFARLLRSRVTDVAIGPVSSAADDLVQKPFLRYQLVAVTGPATTLGARPRPEVLRSQTWLLGPSAAEPAGVTARLLAQLGVPESNQRIFQSHAAALEQAMRGAGVALAVSFAVADDIAAGRLVEVGGFGTRGDGTWSILTLDRHAAPPAAAELTRFITTPRATQAMLTGTGAGIGRFRPAVHVTLWS